MRCTNCGHELKNGCSVCPVCGSSIGGFGQSGFGGFDSFGSSGTSQVNGFNTGFGSTPQNQNGYGDQGSGFDFGGYGSFGQGGYQPPQKRKSKTWLIVLICAICAAVIAIVALVSFLASSDSGTPLSSDTSETFYTANIPATTKEETTSEPSVLSAAPPPILVYITETSAVTTAKPATEPIAWTEPFTETEAATTAEPAAPEPSEIIPFFELRYFLNALDARELAVLCALYEGVMNFEEEISLPCTVTPEELSDIVDILHYECPEIFQIDRTRSYTYYYVSNKNEVHSIEFPYALTESEYTAMRAKCEDVIDSFVRATNGLSDVEKEKYVYDYMGQNCHYRIEAPYSGCAYGALINGFAKCDGFSFAMKWAMETMGIQCLCVGGDSLSGGMGHAWNIIDLGGVYYHLDATFGVPTDETVRDGLDYQIYHGFNTTDIWARENYKLYDHYEKFAPVPRCTVATNSYYASRGGFVRAGEDPVDVIFSLLDDLERGDVERIELQFENSADFKKFTNNCNHYIEEALTRYGMSWSRTRYFYHDYYAFTLTIY